MYVTAAYWTCIADLAYFLSHFLLWKIHYSSWQSGDDMELFIQNKTRSFSYYFYSAQSQIAAQRYFINVKNYSNLFFDH